MLPGSSWARASPRTTRTTAARTSSRAAPRARTASAAASTGWARSARSTSRSRRSGSGRTANPTARRRRLGHGFNDEQKSWAVGGLLGFGGFTFGAGYKRQDDFAPEFQDNDIVNVGLKYGFGAANVSVGYEFDKFGESDLDDAHVFVVSGDLGLLPGVTLLADVSYNTEDLEARDDDEVSSRTTPSAGS